MYYFTCESVFNICIITYCMMTQYVNKKARLIIPKHNDQLMSMLPSLEKLPYVEKIITVSASECDDLSKVVEELEISKDDIFHQLSLAKVSCSFLKEFRKKNSKIILIEEGAGVISDVTKHIELMEAKFSISNMDIVVHDFNELWKIFGTYRGNNIKVQWLNMKERFEENEFREIFLSYMNEIFNLSEVCNFNYSICFFDHYILTASGAASDKFKNFFLEKLVDCFGDNSYIIKQHPNDNSIGMYKAEYNVMSENKIPWEILRLMNYNNSQVQISISYSVSGTITNDILMLGNKIYVCFLNKLLLNCGVDLYPEEIFNGFLECLDEDARKRVFFPESFTELKQIIARITQKKQMNSDEEIRMYIDELEAEREFLASFYQNNIINVPKEKRTSSILGNIDEKWECICHQYISDKTKKLDLQFDISIRENVKLFRWYVVGGRCVSVNITSIHYISEEKSYEVPKGKIRFLEAKYGGNDFWDFPNFDGLVEFETEYIPTSIIIKAEIKYNDNIDNIIYLSNTKVGYLCSEIDIRDTMLKSEKIENAKLKEYIRLKDKMDMDMKDKIEELNVTLSKKDEELEELICELQYCREHPIKALFKRKNL